MGGWETIPNTTMSPQEVLEGTQIPGVGGGWEGGTIPNVTPSQPESELRSCVKVEVDVLGSRP